MAHGMLEIEEMPNEPVEDPIQRLQRSSTPAAASEDDAQLIRPQPGFVVKTTDDTGRKLFINVCGAEEVDALGDWANGQVPAAVTKALQELDSPMGEASNEALRLPVSVGERREDIDHTGAPSYVIDAIFNADVMRAAAEVRRLKNFLIQLLLSYVGTKHDTKLDCINYKLPRMRYKGGPGPQPQYIRAAPKQLITEVVDDGSAAAPSFALRVDRAKAAKGSKGDSSPPAPPATQPQQPAVSRQQQHLQQSAAPATAQDHSQAGTASSPAPDLAHSIAFEGCPATAATITVHSEALCSCGPGACSIAAAHDSVSLRLQQQMLEMRLPFSVDATTTDAVIDAKKGWLTITLPFQPYRDVLQQGSAQITEIVAH